MLLLSYTKIIAKINIKEHFLCFSPNNFLVLVLMFNSLMQLKLVFVSGCKVVGWGANFILMLVVLQFSQHHL